jgi:hypothetical protein
LMASRLNPNVSKEPGLCDTKSIAARTLLCVIDKNPAPVLIALNPAAFGAAVGSSGPTTAISGSIESVRLRVVLQNGRPILPSV